MTTSNSLKYKNAESNPSAFITDQIQDTIQGSKTLDPVALQYLPSAEENIIDLHETSDPIGDHPHSPMTGLVHRHNDRVLLKITDICEVYCRFCFRKEMVGKGGGILNAAQLKDALSYIANNKEIREVILTGGDPLTLSNRRLEGLLTELEAINHVEIIRFHTRTPIVQPKRIDDDFVTLINQSSKAIYMVLHVNHAQEINEAVIKMFNRLSRTRAILLSQSVLLKNINNNVDALENLFRTLVKNRIKPYYLHHPDLAPGTGHFRVSIREGQNLMAALKVKLSGLCLPNYVLDIPGGYGKVPIEQGYIETDNDQDYILRDHQGRTHHYRDSRTETVTKNK